MNFSVVIPAFNAAESLERALDSLAIVSKDIQIEVIVIDDASQDETESVIRKYVADFRLIYHRNRKNLGASKSRNLGVEMSSSNAVVFNDCDDESLLNRFTVHSQHLLNHPNNLSFVSSVKQYGKRQVMYSLLDEENIEVSSNEYGRYILLGKKPKANGDLHFPCATMAVTKDLFKKLNGFDVNLKRNEDVDFIIRALKAGSSISTSSAVGVIRHAGSAPHQSAGSNLIGELMLLERYGKDYLSRREQKAAKLWLQSRARYFEKSYISALKLLLISSIFRPSRTLNSIFTRIPKRITHDIRNYLSR
jgi:glycosyltransferase involved in cell wall biosynthesis